MFYSLKKGLLCIIISLEIVLILQVTLDILKINFTQIYLVKINVISNSKYGLTFNGVDFQ